MEGTLKKTKTRKGFDFRAEFVNAKGKQVSFAIAPGERCFNAEQAKDDDPVEFELEGGNIIRKCKIPGKEAQPVAPKPGNTGAWQGRQPKAPATRSGRLENAVAPYNFAPYEPDAILPAFEEPRRWAGSIVCSLEALQPLLVCGAQKKLADESTECRFHTVNGKPVIPGSSLKGMIRSIFEALTFSVLRPMNKAPLFWRNVASGSSSEYQGLFCQDRILGGFLRKQGANYTLIPVEVEPRDYKATKEQAESENCEKVETGGMWVTARSGPNRGQKAHSKCYFFKLPPTDARGEPLDREIVHVFREQMTPSQEGRWPKDKRAERLHKYPGLPVFYRLKNNNCKPDDVANVAELGFCRYFRVKYKYTPWDLAHPNRNENDVAQMKDMATELFGHAGRTALAGRVAFEAATLEGRLWEGRDRDVVLGGPKPTCLPLYIDQTKVEIKTMSHGAKNNPDSMANYNNPKARLRGRKLYWHHQADEKYFPRPPKQDGKPENRKIVSRLFPLAPGARGSFVIHLNRLTDSELGALFSALELPQGHEHKLGMGKSLGFGSVRIRIERALIHDNAQFYSSLASRLGNRQPEEMDKAARDGLRSRFQEKVLARLAEIYPAWKGHKAYETLPPIKALFTMLDYANKPDPAQCRTMGLRGPEPNFGEHAILPTPEAVCAKGKK